MRCPSDLPARRVALRCRLRPCRTSRDSHTHIHLDSCHRPTLVPPSFRVPTVYLRTGQMKVMTLRGANSSRVLHFGTVRRLLHLPRNREPPAAMTGGT